MDLTSIMVAAISALGTGIGSLYGIKKSSGLTDYKIDRLTEEVKKHNDFASRIPLIEEKLKVTNHRLNDLEDNQK